MKIDTILELQPVIPVLVIEDPAHARPIGQALIDGGLRALEVTLRTPAAVESIAEMSKIRGAVVGAGTILNEAQLDQALAAGAKYVVSPGLTERLARAALERSAPLLPGVANASDIMRGLDLGFKFFKYFPAIASGGIPALKALAGPFGGVKFCPTGGITQENASEWLALPQVLCVGGSWVVPKGPPQVNEIKLRAGKAASLRGH